MWSSVLSSFLPWEYFGPRRVSLIGEGKVSALYSYDPFLERMALGLLPRETGVRRIVVSLDEIDNEWLESRFFSDDLFSDEESYFFFQGSGTDKRLREQIFHSLHQIAAKRVLFVCRGDALFFKQLCKSEYVLGHWIKEPPFWQHNRLFDLLSRLLKVGVASDVREYLLDVAKGGVQEVVNALKIIRLNFPVADSVTLEAVRELVAPGAADHFRLAHSYGNREFLSFYRNLLSCDLSFDGYRSLMAFLQSHLIKVYDTGYLGLKERLSRYDRAVLEQGRQWSDKDELAGHIQKISEWEVLAKQRHVLLKPWLRRAYLRSKMDISG